MNSSASHYTRSDFEYSRDFITPCHHQSLCVQHIIKQNMNIYERNKNKDKFDKPFLYFSFNQCNSHFACALKDGFCIVNTEPLKVETKRVFKQGIGIVEMLFRSNILALVGGGPNPAFPPNKVIMWDDFNQQIIGEIVCSKPIKNVKLLKDLVVIVLEDQVLVYDQNFEQQEAFETSPNPKGICVLSPDSDNTVLAFPTVHQGMIRVQLLSSSKKTYIKAHESNISCLAISRDGTKIASASEKGTLIRIYDTESGNLLKEVRRGTSNAEILSIAFSNDANFLCCSSDKGTIHLFCISQKSKENVAPNRTSSLSLLSYVVDIKYVSSEWSLAEYKNVDGASICVFGSDNSTIKGSYHHFDRELLMQKFSGHRKRSFYNIDLRS
jgi:WD40 repeat protein